MSCSLNMTLLYEVEMRGQTAVLTKQGTDTVTSKLHKYAKGKGFHASCGKNNDALFLCAMISLLKTEE